MSLGFTSGEARHEERVLHGELAELENAVVAFFWEGKTPRMGTLTVTLCWGTGTGSWGLSWGLSSRR